MSIERFGFRSPIIIQKGTGRVIAGHGRIKAMKALGKKEAPCLEWDVQDENEMAAYTILDNSLVINPGFDDESLSELLQQLDADTDIDMSVFGFEEMDLRELLGDTESFDIVEDEPPEAPEQAISKTGDLWTLGNHRLLVADCTVEANINKLMGGKKANLCLTDPPYGIQEEYLNYEDSKENLIDLISKFLPLIKKVSKTILITSGNKHQKLYPVPDWVLCWFVPAGIGIGPWGFTCWQPILVYGDDPYLKEGKGSRPDGFTITEGASTKKHPCAKPLKVWSWLIERGSTNQKEIILDVFGGSGTTLIASEQLNRICYMMEIDPHYCDVILQRYFNLTNISPIRDDGVKWTSLIKEE